MSSVAFVIEGAYLAALTGGGAFFAAFALMITAGPCLATLARHQETRLSYQRVWVVLALILGLLLARFADGVSSNYLATLFEQTQPQLKQYSETVESNPSVTMQIFDAVLTMAIYSWMAGVFALPRYFREPSMLEAHARSAEINRLRLEKHQTETKLSVLQAQVEPHFLFNTLASVKGTIREDPALAESTIDALVDYLRATIPKMRQQPQTESTLGAQFKLCERYLAVMRLRMSGRLSYQSHLPSELHDLPFPPLLLISLVENAIKHGIEPKREGGNVTLSAKRDGDRLLVEVIDDGVGLERDTAVIDPSSGTGVGLRNVRQQLKALFGEQAKFSLSSQGVGATAALSFPL